MNDRQALMERPESEAENTRTEGDAEFQRLLEGAAWSPEYRIGDAIGSQEITGILPDARPRVASDRPLDRPPDRPPDLEDYELLEELGRGGMGAVYKARQKRTARLVAVKVISGWRGAHPEVVRRFEREVRILGRLRHPRIADIYTAGTTRDGDPYFVMELVDGVTLDRFQPSEPRLRVKLELFRKICDAVAHSHRLGAIHRDLKPQNVMVCGGGTEVKVLDFGLARLDDSDSEALTQEGHLQGTLPYMSPEQIQGEPLTTLSDVYALGVMLYELVTGKRPYAVPSQNLREAVRVICETRPGPPSAVSSGHPRKKDLDAIVLKALEKEPSRRYQSVADLSGDIEKYMTNQPVLPRQIRFRVFRSFYHLGLFCRRHRAAVAIAATAGLMFLAGAVDQARRLRVDRLEEQGRQELLAGRVQQASVYLARAALLGNDSPALRLQLGLANQAIMTPVMTLYEPTASSVRTSVSSDGKRVLTIGQDRTAKVWEMPSGSLLFSLNPRCTNERVSAFISPDGRAVATACEDGPKILWSLEPQREVASLGADDEVFEGVAFSPDGRLLAYGGWMVGSRGSSTTVRDSRNGQSLAKLAGRPVEFSRDGSRLLLARWDSAVLADARTGKVLLSLQGVVFPRLRGDGSRIVTAGPDGAKLWDAANGNLVAELDSSLLKSMGLRPEDDDSSVRSAEFSADGSTVVTVGGATATSVWDADDGQNTEIYSGAEFKGDLASLSPDGSRLLVAGALGVNVIETKSGRLLDTLRVGGEATVDAGFVLDGSHVMTSRHGMTELWRVGAQTWPIALAGQLAGLQTIAFNPSGTRLLTVSTDGTVQFWDAASGRLLRTLDDSDGSAAKLFAASRLRHYEPLETLRGAADTWAETHRDLLRAMGWDRLELPSRALMGRLRSEMRYRFVRTDGPRSSARGVLEELKQAMAISPDGKLFASRGPGDMVQIWGTQTAQLVASFTPLSGEILTAAFSPDARWIATGSARGRAELWEVSSGKLLMSQDSHPWPVVSVAFSPDGERLATGTLGRAVKIWQISPETRPLEDVESMLRCRVPWRLEADKLIPALPDPRSCEATTVVMPAKAGVP